MSRAGVAHAVMLVTGPETRLSVCQRVRVQALFGCQWTQGVARMHAHSANNSGRWHPLAEHLGSVARLAKAFAEGLHWSEEAWLAGLLHDLGKYGDRFQARLRGQDSGLDHWSQGAWLALTDHRAVAAALAIQGHHVGLQRGNVDSLRQLSPEALARNHPFRLELSDPALYTFVQI